MDPQAVDCRLQERAGRGRLVFAVTRGQEQLSGPGNREELGERGETMREEERQIEAKLVQGILQMLR